MTDASPPAARKRILMLGATGTAGSATAQALLAAGHEVVCIVRPDSAAALPHGAERRAAQVTDAASLDADGFQDDRFDAVVSCLTSRTGAPKDAWALDYQAQSDALRLAKARGVPQFVLLSAICVQKPKLAFQKAKLAFEAELIASGLTYSIVRPTAFFKSISGQIARVRDGKPYLMFGDGTLTACKPISDADLGRFIALCLTDPALHNQILPIGGPGPALTPAEQGAALFDLSGMPAKTRKVPVALFDIIIALSSAVSKVAPSWAEKAEFARIAKYYATESMLVWDAAAERYDADATPEFGQDRLFDHYAKVLDDGQEIDLREHAVF